MSQEDTSTPVKPCILSESEDELETKTPNEIIFKAKEELGRIPSMLVDQCQTAIRDDMAAFFRSVVTLKVLNGTCDHTSVLESAEKNVNVKLSRLMDRMRKSLRYLSSGVNLRWPIDDCLCGICMDQMFGAGASKDPYAIPTCGHVYCGTCLRDARSSRPEISCPKCRDPKSDGSKPIKLFL